MKGLHYLLLAATLSLLGCGKDAPEPAPPAVPPAAEGAPAQVSPPPDEFDEKLAKAQKILQKVEMGLKIAQALKAAVEDSVERNRGIPPSFADVRARNVPPSDSEVESIDLTDSGSIIVEYAPEADFPGGTIELKPVVSNGRVSSWDCSGGTLSAEYRPDTCG
jgi:hypothetical protein